jgi:hypothetical protein
LGAKLPSSILPKNSFGFGGAPYEINANENIIMAIQNDVFIIYQISQTFYASTI